MKLKKKPNKLVNSSNLKGLVHKVLTIRRLVSSAAQTRCKRARHVHTLDGVRYLSTFGRRVTRHSEEVHARDSGYSGELSSGLVHLRGLCYLPNTSVTRH